MARVHEVALSQQLARIVARAAAGRRVVTVRLEVGELRQVVPETLVHAWSFVAPAAGLAGSHLEIASIPAVIRCDSGHETILGPDLGFACATCGSRQTAIMAGEEFRVLDIDVE